MNRDRIELLWLGKNPLEGFSVSLCNTNNTRSSIATPAGRLVLVLHNGQVHWKTEYNLTDHLGNVQVVFAAHANGQPEVMQQTSYYPFGYTLQQNDYYASVTSENKNLYNGKELQDDVLAGSRLDWYDYGARFYDPVVLRFLTFDPLAEKNTWANPYGYCYNNPVNSIDPNGELPVILIPVIKGVIGAAIDAAAQVSVSMANGKGFTEALSNIDYTSVGASFFTSALAMPGMSTAAKVTSVAFVATDALIDINANGDIQSVGEVVGKNKPVINATIDATSSFLPGRVVDNVTSTFNKAVSSDLGSSAAATLSTGTKQSLKESQEVVNSVGFQIGAKSMSDYVGGLIGGQATESTTSTTSTTSSRSVLMPNEGTFVQPADATFVRPLRPLRPLNE